MKVKRILVSQPKPETEKSPYFDIAQKYKVKIDFRPFIQVEGVDAKEFRKDRINILGHSAVIFTSRHAADHFFRLCNELRIAVPESLKYFCLSESTAYYLQKYVQFRKRKIFHGKQTFADLNDVIKKHSNENFLFPCSDIKQDDISIFLEKQKIKYTRAVMFKTVMSNLRDIAHDEYDILVFFSPLGVKSLLKNFPNFTQKHIKIAAFGAATAKEVLESKLNLNIYSPTPQAPSMTMAIENFVKSPEKAMASFALPEGLIEKPALKTAKKATPKVAPKAQAVKAAPVKTAAAKVPAVKVAPAKKTAGAKTSAKLPAKKSPAKAAVAAEKPATKKSKSDLVKAQTTNTIPTDVQKPDAR